MILKGFRVKEFRSVVDSGWIDADQITALIGTNESGKTRACLINRNRLYHFNKITIEAI